MASDTMPPLVFEMLVGYTIGGEVGWVNYGEWRAIELCWKRTLFNPPEGRKRMTGMRLEMRCNPAWKGGSGELKIEALENEENFSKACTATHLRRKKWGGIIFCVLIYYAYAVCMCRVSLLILSSQTPPCKTDWTEVLFLFAFNSDLIMFCCMPTVRYCLNLFSTHKWERP